MPLNSTGIEASSSSVFEAAAPGVVTRARNNIHMPKVYTNGTVRYAFSCIYDELSLLDATLC